MKSAGGGMNTYQVVQVPAVSTIAVSKSRPVFRTGRAGGTIVIGTEYLGTLVGNTGFLATQYPINPGMYTTFPELSQIACNFTRWRVRRLVARLIPLQGTSAVGAIMLSPQYDVLDQDPPTEQQFNQYRNVKQYPLGATADWFIKEKLDLMACNAASMGLARDLYVRVGPLASNLDQKTYDMANLVVAVSGTANSTSIVAKIWLDYEIELFDICPSRLLGTSATLNGVPVNSSNLFGTTVVNPSSGGNIAATAATNTITFGGIGEYLVDLLVVGTGVSALGGTTSTNTVTYTAGAAAVLAAATTARITFAVRSTAFNQTLALTATATTVTSVYATILYANYSQLVAAGNY